jgi:hypothetical protein
MSLLIGIGLTQFGTEWRWNLGVVGISLWNAFSGIRNKGCIRSNDHN